MDRGSEGFGVMFAVQAECGWCLIVMFFVRLISGFFNDLEIEVDNLGYLLWLHEDF